MTRRATLSLGAACLALALSACAGGNDGGRHQTPPSTVASVPRVLVLGDSNLFESGAQVDLALRDAGVEPTLHGVPRYGLKDLEYWLDQLGTFLADDPDVVVVGLGTNDALSPTDVFAFPARLDEMMRTIGDRPVVWLTHVDERPAAPADAGRTVNQVIRDAADRWSNLTVLDFTTQIAADPTILRADALHFSEHGMQVYGAAIADATSEVLGTLVVAEQR